MAINRNSSVSEELRDVFKTQQNVDGNIQQVVNQIVPVCDVNPKHARVCNVVVAKNATGTIYSTPTDKDFYLIAAQLTSNAVNQGTAPEDSMSLTLPTGETTVFLVNKVSSANPGNDSNSISISFPVPILVKRGTNITITGSTSNRHGVIYGYTVDNPRA